MWKLTSKSIIVFHKTTPIQISEYSFEDLVDLFKTKSYPRFDYTYYQDSSQRLTWDVSNHSDLVVVLASNQNSVYLILYKAN